MKKKEKSPGEIWSDGLTKVWKVLINNILSLDPYSEEGKKKILENGKLYIRSLERPYNILQKAYYKNKGKINSEEKKKTLLDLNNQLKELSMLKKYDYKYWIKWANDNKKFIE
jgi:hypothetical protein